MVLLSEAFRWRLRRLIFGVTKKNFKKTISEILILFEAFKYSAQLEALGFLFEEFLRLETPNTAASSSSPSSSFFSSFFSSSLFSSSHGSGRLFRFVGSGGGGNGGGACFLFRSSIIMSGGGVGGDGIVLGSQTCRVALLQAVVVELLRDTNPGSCCVRWKGAVLIIRALEEICVKYRRPSSSPVSTGGGVGGGGISSSPSSLTSSLSSISSIGGSSIYNSTSIGKRGNYWLPSVTFITARSSSSSSSLLRRGSENFHQLLVPQFLSTPFFLGGSGEGEDSGRGGGGAGEGVVGEALVRLGFICRLTVEQQLVLTLALWESGMWPSTREESTFVLRQQLDEYVSLLNAEEAEEGERRDEEVVVGDCDEDNVEEEVEEIKDYEGKETTNLLREGKRIRGRRMRREVQSKDQFRRWSVGDFGTMMTSGGCTGSSSVGGGGSQLRCNRIRIDRRTSVDTSKKMFSYLSLEMEGGGGRDEERNHRRVRRFLLPLSVLYRVFEFLCWCCDGGGDYKEEMPSQRRASNESSHFSFSSSSSSSSSDGYDDEYPNVDPHLEGLRRIAITIWRYHRCYHEATGVMNELLLSSIFECLKNKLRVGDEVGDLILSGCCRRKKERVEVKNEIGEEKAEDEGNSSFLADAVGDEKENEEYIHSLQSNNEDRECFRRHLRVTDEREVGKSNAKDREEMKILTQTEEEEGNENESQRWKSSKFSSRSSETKWERKGSDEKVESGGYSSSEEDEESRRAFDLYDDEMSEEEEDENIKMMMRKMRRRGGKRDHKKVLEILGGSRGMGKLPVWEDERRRCLWLEGEDIRQRKEERGGMQILNNNKEHENSSSSSSLCVASQVWSTKNRKVVDIDDNVVEVEEKGKGGGGEEKILKFQESSKSCDWGIRPEEILVDLMILDDEENIRIKSTTLSPPCASSPSLPSFSFSSSFSSFSNNFLSISSSSDHPIPINGDVLTAAVLSLFGRLGEVQVAEILISLLRAQLLMMAESNEDRESVVKEKWNITKSLMTTADSSRKKKVVVVDSDTQSTLGRVEGDEGGGVALKSQRKKIMTTEQEGGDMILNAEGDDKSNRTTTMTKQFILVSSSSSVMRNTAKGIVSVDGSSSSSSGGGGGGGGIGVRGRRSSSNGGGVGGGGGDHHNVGVGGGDGDERLGVGGRLTLVSMSSLFISVVWHQWERWRRRRNEGLDDAEVVVPFTDLLCFGNDVWWGKDIMNENSGGGGGGSGGGKDEGIRRNADEDNDGLGEFVDVLRRQMGDVKWSRVFKVMPYVRRCDYPLLKGEGCREVESLEEGRRRGWRGDVKVVTFMISLLQLRYGGALGRMGGGMRSIRRLEEERERKEKEVEEEENDGWMGEVKWKEKGRKTTDKSSSSINVTSTLMKLMLKKSSREFQDILEIVSMLVVISDYQWKNGKTQLPLLLMAITMMMPTKSFYKLNVDVFYEGIGAAVEGVGRGEGRRSSTSVGTANIGCSDHSSGGDSCRFGSSRSSVCVDEEECSSGESMIYNSVLSSSSSWLLNWKSSRTTSLIEDDIMDRLVLFSSSVIWLEEEMRRKKMEWRERWGVGEAKGVMSELRFQGIYQLIKEIVVCFSNPVEVEKWVSNFISYLGNDHICGSSSGSGKNDGFGRRCRMNWEEVVVEEIRETEVEKRNRWWCYLRGWICFVLIVSLSQFEFMLQMCSSDFGWEMEKIFCFNHPFDILASSSVSSSSSKEGEWEYDDEEEEDGGVDSGDDNKYHRRCFLFPSKYGVGGRDEIGGGVDDTRRKGEKAWGLILREFADVCLMVAFCLMWAEMNRCDDNKEEELFVNDVIRNDDEERRNEGKEEIIVKVGKEEDKLSLWLQQRDCHHPFLYDCLLHMGVKGALEKPQAVFFPAMIRTLFDVTPKILLWLVMREGQKSLKWVREVVMALKPLELKKKKTQPQREAELIKRNMSKEDHQLSSRKYLKRLRKQMMADEEKKAKEEGEEDETKMILISVEDDKTRGERLLQWLFCDVEGVDTEWHIFVLLELVCVIADVCFNTITTTTTTTTTSSSSLLSSASCAFLQRWLEDSRVRWRNLPSFSLAVTAFLHFKRSFSEEEEKEEENSAGGGSGGGMHEEKNVKVDDLWNLKRTSSCSELISFILSFSSTSSSSEERGIRLNDEWRTLLLMSLEKPQPPTSLNLTPQLNERFVEGLVGNCWNTKGQESSKTCLSTFSASLQNDVIGVGSSVVVSPSSLTFRSSHFISSPTYFPEVVSSISGVAAFSSSFSSSSSPIVISSSLQVRTSGMQSSKLHLPGGLLSGGEAAAGGLEGGGRRFSTSSSISGSSVSGSSSARNLGTSSSIGFCDFSSNSSVSSSVSSSGGLLSSSLIGGGGGEATSKVAKGEADHSTGSSNSGLVVTAVGVTTAIVSVGDTSNSRSSSRNGGGGGLSSSTSNNISSIMTSSMLRSFSSSATGTSGDGEGGDSSSSSSSSSASSTSSSFSSAMVASSSSSHRQSVGLSPPPLSSSSVSTPSSSSSSSSSSFTVSSSRSYSDNIAALTSAVAAISLHSYSTSEVSAARSVGSPTPVSTSSTPTPPNSSVGISSSTSGSVVASRGGIGGVTTAVGSSSSSAMASSLISAAALTGGIKTPPLLQGNIDNNKIEGNESGGATATSSTVVTEAPVGVSANAAMITSTPTTATSSGAANAGVSGKIEEGGNGSTRSGNGGAAASGGGMHQEELEAEVNKYFSKLYTGEMPVSKMLELMQCLSQHPQGSKELDIFNNMLITLFNECRFFPKYPPPELAITAELFGKMIQLDLLTAHGNSLMLALRCVVEALRKGVLSKMFNFGIIALEQFLEKFPSCPQFLEALVQIPDLRQHYPEYNIYAERILKALPENLQQAPYLHSTVIQSLQLPFPPVRKSCGGVSSQSSSGMSTVTSAAGVMLNATTTGIFSSVMSSSSSTSNAISGVGAAALLSGPRGFASLSLTPQQSSTPLGPLASSTSSSSSSQHPVGSGGVSGGVGGGVGGSTTSQATPIQRNLPMQLTPEQLQGFGLGQIEALMNDPEILEPVIQPSSTFMDHVALIFNSLVITNIDQKADDMREELQPDHYNWLSFYLVKSRASKEHNLHSIFIEFIDKLRHPKLLDIITNMTYDCLNVLLKYVDQAKESSSYRTVLKNLGLWLGRITLARNRPLRSKNMDVKSLLFEAYENGRLVAVLPLVCKIMEGVKSSKNFKPPNPWTTAVFMLLGEIHALPNIRTNLIFEVEVLFKNLSMNVADYHGRTDHLLKKKCPPVGSSDFTTKRPIPLLGGLLPSALQIQQQQAQYQQHIQQQQQNSAAATVGAPTSQQSQGQQQQQHPASIVAFNNNPLGVALKWTESQQPQPGAAVGRGGGGGGGPPPAGLPFSHPSVFPPAAGDSGGGGGGATAPHPSRHQQLPLLGQQTSSDGGGVGVAAAAARTTTSGQIINSQQTSTDLGSGKLLLGRPTMTVLSAAGNAVALASHLTTGPGGVSSVTAAGGGGGPHAHGNSSATAAAAASLMNDVGTVAATTASSQPQHPPPLPPPSPSPVGDSPSTISGRRSVLPLGAMTTGAASTSGEGRHLPLPPPTATSSSLHPQSEIMRNDPLSSDASLVNTFPPIGLLHYQQQQANINAAAGGSANAAMYGAASAQRAGLPLPSSLQPPPHPAPPPSGVGVCGSSSSSTSSASSSSLAASSSPPSSSPGGGGGTSSGSSSSSGPERVLLTQADQMLQNLTNSVVISPSIALFQIQPNLRPVVPLAVDRAIREIISAVVERSVTISCVTTRELVGKDFAMESDDSLVKRAAHLMVASLAGSLALVTCREPLRVSLTQHLRQLLQPASTKDCNDQVLIEQVVQIISADNLELGCTLIEQAVVEKALRDIEETMATGIIMRKRAREQGVRFVDHSVVNLQTKWPLHLPTPLKLRSSLTNRQLQVYKDFMHLGPLKKMHSAASAGTAGGVGTGAAATAGGGTHSSSSSASGTVVIATPTAVASSTTMGGGTAAGMGSNSSTLMGGVVGGGPMASSTSGDAGGVAVMSSSSGVLTSQLQQRQAAAGTSSAAGGRVLAAPQPPPPIMSAMNGGAGGSAAISSGQSGSGAGGAATPASGGGGMVEGQQQLTSHLLATQNQAVAARALIVRQQQQQQQQQQAVAVATASAVAAARQQQQQQHLQPHSILSQQSLQLSESHVSSGNSSLAAAASSASSVAAAAMARRANGSSSSGTAAAANLLSVSTMLSMSTGGVSSSVSAMGGHHLHGQTTAGFAGVQGGGVGGSSSFSTPLTTSTSATAATSSSMSRECSAATTSTQKSGSGGASGATVVAADIPSLHALPVVQPNEPVAIPPVGDLPLSTVMAKLEECLAQLKEAVKDVINSMPIVPIPGTQTKGSRPLGAMAVAEDVLPTCSPSLSVLACLSSDHDLFTFARAFPAIVATAQRREECAEAIAEKLLRAIVDVSGACGRNGETAGNPPHPMRGVEPSGLYLEVYFGLLYSLVKQSSSLRKNMLEALRYSVATADLSKKFHVEVSSYFIRYDLLNLSDYDRHLVDLMDNGRCLNAVEFALSLMHKVLLDLRVASASQFTLTIEMLSTTSPSIFSPKLLSLSGWTPMPANEARLQLLEEVRQMLLNNEESSSDLKDPPQTGGGGGGVEGKRIRTFSNLVEMNEQNSLVEVKCRRLPRPPIVSDQHRKLISLIFDEWVRLSFGHPKDKAHQHWAQFFQKVSHQGLLRMDENTDRFFYVCLEKAVMRASVLLQQQQQQRGRGVGGGGGGGKKKEGEMTVEDSKDEDNEEDGQQRGGGRGGGGKGEDGKEDLGATTTTTSDGRGGGVVDEKRMDEANGPNTFNVEGDGVTFSFSSLNDVEGVGNKSREGGGKRTGELGGGVGGIGGDENSSSSSPHIDCVGGGIGGDEENEELISLRTPPEFLTRCLETSSLDALAKMIVAMMKLVDPTQISPVTILQKGLAVICRHIHYEAEVRGATMNQRPYYRLLLCLLLEINSPDRTMESQNLPSLLAFANALSLLNPTRVPSFSFAWLELISHRLFLPKLLKKVKGWAPFQRLLTQHFRFLHPFLRSVHLSDPIRALYKGTLRVLLVLLHDFPEFLCDYHFAFCDVLPLNCVQLRNLILSAFPRNMKLPDPFMPNLKVDLLPEIKSLPRILSHYTVNLLLSSLKQDIDIYWKTRNRIRLSEIKRKLLLSRHEALRCGTKYNIPLMNAVLLYVGVSLPGKIPGVNQQQVEIGPSLDLLMYLANELDMEGRYLLMSAISNHLRYPNAHTHYFSCLLLWLFGESQEELVQEQITRVLLERLIVHRPHPWGLLITFIELIKNPRFNFWNCSFVHAAPEVEKLFQSVAQTCLGHQGAQVQQQQQQCSISASQTTSSANPHPSLSSSTPPPNLPLPSSTPVLSSSATTTTTPPPPLLPTGIKTAATPTLYQQQQALSVSSSSSVTAAPLPSSSTQHQPTHLLQRSTPPPPVVPLASFSASTSNSSEVIGGSVGYIDSIDVSKSSGDVVGGIAGGTIMTSSSSITTTPVITSSSLPQSFNSGMSSSSSSSGWQLSLATATSGNHSGGVNVGGGGAAVPATTAAFSKSASPNVSSGGGGGRNSGEEKRNIRVRTSVVGGMSKRSEVKG